MGLRVYGLLMSTCTARVMICLNEKAVDFELVPVNLFAAEHKLPSFLSKNPFGKIPVLEDGDLTLFESRAITSYVCEKYKKEGSDLLRHGNLEEAAVVKQWLEVESQHYNPNIQPIISQVFVLPMQGKACDQAIVDAHVEQFSKVLDVYEARFSTSKYVAGDFFSLADLHCLPYTFYLMKTEYAKLINDRPHVKAWWEDISSRGAFLKVAENMKFGGNMRHNQEDLELWQQCVGTYGRREITWSLRGCQSLEVVWQRNLGYKMSPTKKDFAKINCDASILKDLGCAVRDKW
ncbi:hypothetical protein V2J09_009243 [Rumex salicifolius]